MTRLLLALFLALMPLQADISFSNTSAGGDGEYITCGTDAELDDWWQSNWTICTRVNITGSEPTNVQPRFWSSRDGAGGMGVFVDLAAAQDVPKIATDYSSTDMFVYAGTVNTDYWTTSSGWKTICYSVTVSDGTPIGAGSTVFSDEAGTLTDSTIALGSGTLQTDAGHDRRIGGSSAGFHHLTGQIEWMVLWDAALSQTEINRITTERIGIRGVMGVNNDNLFMALPFKDGDHNQTEASVTHIKDIGPLRHHCTLAGGTWKRRTSN